MLMLLLVLLTVLIVLLLQQLVMQLQLQLQVLLGSRETCVCAVVGKTWPAVVCCTHRSVWLPAHAVSDTHSFVSSVCLT